LSNAAKFTLNGFIEFGYALNSDQIEIFVKDTGIGIPEDKQELIFDRFHKIENPGVINSSGTGLGLSIVKKLANMLGGNITVVSEINRGSAFTVTLPLSTEIKHVTLGEKLADSIPVNPNWASKHVLIVEDEYPTYVLLESMLTPTGLNVTWAKDGKEALETMSCQRQIDVVLMDIKMPGMSGIEAFTEFRKLNHSLPIIAQTAFAMTEDCERFREIGFDGYISKPIIVNELFKVLNNVL
jgi:CheY-like chemotaxis protein